MNDACRREMLQKKEQHSEGGGLCSRGLAGKFAVFDFFDQRQLLRPQPQWQEQPFPSAFPPQTETQYGMPYGPELAQPFPSAFPPQTETQYGMPYGPELAQPCPSAFPLQTEMQHGMPGMPGMPYFPTQPWPSQIDSQSPPVQVVDLAGRPQRRECHPRFCLVDRVGKHKAFSSVSQISGANYEHMIHEVLQQVFRSGFSRILLAGRTQDSPERDRLSRCQQKVADLLQLTVSDDAAARMRSKGHAQSEAEIDLVFQGSFANFDSKFRQLGEVKVEATCEMVQTVLVEICSDSRFVPQKLYQIELQSCLIARDGKLDNKALQPDTTGFAIVFNRAAIHIETRELVEELGLDKVRSLLDNQKLHIVYFQPEAVTPAALRMASDAKAEANKAQAEANKAQAEAREAKEKVDRLEKMLEGILNAQGHQRAQPSAP
eukprot:s9641_g2.t1